MIADYDSSEPKYIPIILSIVISILLVIGITISVIYYFKSVVSMREYKNDLSNREALELQQLRKYEDDFLNSKSQDKVNIDEAIRIINFNYN